LTVYEATYLELARRRKLALATRDEVLRRAGRRLELKTL
jgi:predicted nucleic acid-binding protein